MLHLPDVTQLMRDEVDRRVATAQENDSVHREAVEAGEPRQPEGERHGQDADTLDAHGPRPPVEPVEPRLRSQQALVHAEIVCDELTRR